MDHVMDADVLIAGGGPNGLMLAGELALNGVRPVVLEREVTRNRPTRANGLVGRVAHVFDRRGLLSRCGMGDGPPSPSPFFQFGGLPLDLRGLVDNPMTGVPLPQPRVEEILEERARELGSDVRRGHELTGCTDADGDANGRVDCAVRGPDGAYRVRARFLVGADGSRSLVRKAAGIGFPGGGRDDFVSRVAEVVLPPGLDAPDGGLDLPGTGRVPLGFTRTGSGVFTTARFPTGVRLVGTNEWHRPPPDEPMSLDELRASVRRVLGADLPMRAPGGPGPHRLFRHTLVSRCADRYRAGRVLLVGDAAHIQFGIGGPGLNLGLQDAVNLGWKLAAEIRGTAPPGLLDSYDAERRPVAERVLMQTRAQVALLAPGEEVTALRTLFTELLRYPATRHHITATMSGADVRYDPRPAERTDCEPDDPADPAGRAPSPDVFASEDPARRLSPPDVSAAGTPVPAPHPLAGGWAADLPVRRVSHPMGAAPRAPVPGRDGTTAADGGPAPADHDVVALMDRDEVTLVDRSEAAARPQEGATRLAVLQRGGRPLLVTLADPADPAVQIAEVAAGWVDRVDLVHTCPDGVDAPAAAMLIRPDGYVAWAADPGEAASTVRAGLRAALTTWFGAPVSA